MKKMSLPVWVEWIEVSVGIFLTQGGSVSTRLGRVD